MARVRVRARVSSYKMVVCIGASYMTVVCISGSAEVSMAVRGGLTRPRHGDGEAWGWR